MGLAPTAVAALQAVHALCPNDQLLSAQSLLQQLQSPAASHSLPSDAAAAGLAPGFQVAGFPAGNTAWGLTVSRLLRLPYQTLFNAVVRNLLLPAVCGNSSALGARPANAEGADAGIAAMLPPLDRLLQSGEAAAALLLQAGAFYAHSCQAMLQWEGPNERCCVSASAGVVLPSRLALQSLCCQKVVTFQDAMLQKPTAEATSSQQHAMNDFVPTLLRQLSVAAFDTTRVMLRLVLDEQVSSCPPQPLLFGFQTL